MASPSPSAPPRGSSGPLLLLACLLGLARFHRLGEWSLWIDEALTVADGWHGEGISNPLGYWLVRVCAGWLGGPEPVALRLPAALAGWLTIPLTWWAFRPLVGDRRAALAALLVAVSSWSLYWSQNARFYTPAQAVGLVGTGLFLRGLLAGRTPPAVAGLLVVGLGAAFHPTALLLAGALVVGAWLARFEGESARVARRLLVLGALAGLVASPWAWGAFQRYVAVKDRAGLASVAHLAKSTGFFLTPTLCVGALVGGVLAWRGARESGRCLVALPVLGGVAAACAAAFATSSAQYVFVFLPAVCVLAAWPVTCWPRGARLAWMLVMAAPLAANSGLYFAVRHGERPRWKEAYGYVAERRGPNDLILGMQAPVGEYYLAPGSTDLRRPTSVAWCDRMHSRAWERWARRDRALWVVVRPEFFQLWPEEDRRAFQGFLREQCRLQARFAVRMEARDLDVEVWRRR